MVGVSQPPCLQRIPFEDLNVQKFILIVAISIDRNTQHNTFSVCSFRVYLYPSILPIDENLVVLVVVPSMSLRG